MSLINYILDVAGLLLWLNWRSVRFDPFARATPATLMSTLRRAEAPKVRRWHLLAVLGGLLFVRAIFYWQLGPAVNWTPRLDLAFVVLAFRGDAFRQELLFSILSFIQTLVIFYFCLLALVIINRRLAGRDPMQKMILLQLGRVGRWPVPVLAILPLLAGLAFWVALHPLLTYAGALSRAQSNAHVLEQGLLVGTGLYLSLKYLLPAFLFLHLITSYVYLGASPLWDFVTLTARNILSPISKVPMRVGKIDFTPLVGIVVILLLLHALPEIIRGELIEWNLPVWPQ